MTHWSESPEWQRYARRVREELIPMIESSAVSLSIVPEGEPDVKFAVELGMSIMLDKPIIAIVTPGTKVPDHLLRVADHIIEADVRSGTGAQSIAVRLASVLQEYK